MFEVRGKWKCVVVHHHSREPGKNDSRNRSRAPNAACTSVRYGDFRDSSGTSNTTPPGRFHRRISATRGRPILDSHCLRLQHQKAHHDSTPARHLFRDHGASARAPRERVAQLVACRDELFVSENILEVRGDSCILDSHVSFDWRNAPFLARHQPYSLYI